MFKKAQAATEYLIILAVAIILALIIIDNLGGIPKLGVVAKGKTTTNYWRSQPVGIDSYAIAQNGKFVFSIKNNRMDKIILQNIGISLPGEIGGSFNGSELIKPGNSILVYNNHDGLLTGTEKCTLGHTYSYKILITYQDAKTGLITKETGGDGIIPLEGSCVENIPHH